MDCYLFYFIAWYASRVGWALTPPAPYLGTVRHSSVLWGLSSLRTWTQIQNSVHGVLRYWTCKRSCMPSLTLPKSESFPLTSNELWPLVRRTARDRTSQWLGALALPESLEGSVSSTHVEWVTIACKPSSRPSYTLSWPLQPYTYTRGIHLYIHIHMHVHAHTHEHTNKIKQKF